MFRQLRTKTQPYNSNNGNLENMIDTTHKRRLRFSLPITHTLIAPMHGCRANLDVERPPRGLRTGHVGHFPPIPRTAGRRGHLKRGGRWQGPLGMREGVVVAVGILVLVSRSHRSPPRLTTADGGFDDELRQLPVDGGSDVVRSCCCRGRCC